MTDKSIPTDVQYLSVNTILDKYKEASKTLIRTGGPYLIWMLENENDSIIRTPRRGYSNGIPTWSQTFSDFIGGVSFLAGRANAGKSTVAINLIKGLIEQNPDTIVVDISLDDSPRKRMMQFMACISGLRYTEITDPETISENKKALRHQAEETFFSWIGSGRLISLAARERLENSKVLNLRDYNTIIKLMKKLRGDYPTCKIVFFIDAWSNLDFNTSSRFGNEYQYAAMILEQIKNASEEYFVPCVFSAHFVKSDGKSKAGIKDIKGGSGLEYDAAAILIVRNEYRENSLIEPLMYETPTGEENPVLAIDVPKNKVSEWDRTLLYGLDSARCQLVPFNHQQYMDLLEVYQGKRK
jgi:hypothetical protein